MFQWLRLNENALSTAEHTVWQVRALRLVLVSALLLVLIIGMFSVIDAVRDGMHYLVAMALVVAVALACALMRRPLSGGAMLIAIIYAATFCIHYLNQDQEIAKLAIMFVYTLPLIGVIFFGVRMALLLMAMNVLPFMLLIRDQALPSYSNMLAALTAVHGHDQSLLFLLFNIVVPLSVFLLLTGCHAMGKRERVASAKLEESHAQYRQIFEHIDDAIVLCDAQARILKANLLAVVMIGYQVGKGSPADNLFSLLTHKCKDKNEDAVVDILSLKPGQEFQTPDGCLIGIDSIAPTSEKNYIVMLRDISHTRHIQEALNRSKARESFLSSHDQLTQLPNRDLLRHQLDQAMATMSPRSQIALVIIRLDSIRYVNEAHGSSAGDAFIVTFAHALRRLLPTDSLCARLRGVVFCFTLDSTHGSSDVIPQIEYIRRSLPAEITVGREHHLVQLSMAVAFSRPGEINGEELIQRGKIAHDAASKSSGQDLAVFDDQAAAQIHRRLNIEQAIVMALRDHELRLVYQPKVTRDGQIVGLEALIRWRSPMLGDVSPAEFIPVAENCGAIHLITAFVVDQVCAGIRQMLDDIQHCPPIAINLSAIDIVRTDLLDLVNTACQKYCISPDYLEFEITETGLVGNENLAIRHLEALNAKGYAITIDDFGTGYSSLQKLSRFPTKSIKIDQSFVAQIGISEKSELIIRAVVSLAKILSCTTVAEGVETLAQEKFLKAIGCQFFQGFYYYSPMEFQQMRLLLKGD